MIEFSGVTKRYAGAAAISNISLRINKEGIYCLLGRNGAGKTTFMKLLSGYIEASEGIVTIDGKKVSPGNMPEAVNFIESGSVQFNMRVADLIDAADKLQDEFDRDFAAKMVKRFELDTRKKFNQLSLGMKTMLSAIITLSNNTKVILMDEPTLGFDAIMRDQFNTLLLESYSSHPRVIIVSTHQIDDISKVTENLIIINKGKLLLEASMDEIDERAYTITGPADTVAPLISKLNCIGKTTAGTLIAAHIFDNRTAMPQGVTITPLSLQDFFINMVGGNRNE